MPASWIPLDLDGTDVSDVLFRNRSVDYRNRNGNTAPLFWYQGLEVAVLVDQYKCAHLGALHGGFVGVSFGSVGGISHILRRHACFSSFFCLRANPLLYRSRL